MKSTREYLFRMVFRFRWAGETGVIVRKRHVRYIDSMDVHQYGGRELRDPVKTRQRQLAHAYWWTRLRRRIWSPS